MDVSEAVARVGNTQGAMRAADCTLRISVLARATASADRCSFDPGPSGSSSAVQPNRNSRDQTTMKVIEYGSISATSVPMPVSFT